MSHIRFTRDVSIWRVFLIIGALQFFIFSAPRPSTAQGTVEGWQATYWNNTDLSGDPVLTILETDSNENPFLDRNWGNWRPWPQVDKEFFSARWEREVNLQPGRYRFTGTADDGMRVFVNGTKIIDEWQNTVVRAYTGYYDVPTERSVKITVEYYEYQHEALAKLFWDRIYASDTILDGRPYQPQITGWKGEYYNSREPGMLPDYTRDDEKIDFDWGLDSPVPAAIRSEQFSARWTRTLNLAAGTYRFKTETDDGVRLYLNDRLVLDHWQSQTFAPHTADFSHSGGPLKVKMEYYDELGLAAARLTWERLGEAATVAPAGPTGIWTAQYYNNSILAAKPVAVQSEVAIDFDWNVGSYPIPHYITREGFSVRFKGDLSLPAGKYRFRVTVDDGARLWVDEKLVLDKWRKHPEVTYTVDVDLEGGSSPVQLEYFNIFGDGRIKLDMERLDGPMPENLGAGSTAGRPATRSTLTPGGASNEEPGEDASTARIRSSVARIRTGPSSIAPVLVTARRGQTFPVAGRTRYKTWLQVTMPDGASGWLSILDANLSVPVETLAIAEPPEDSSGEQSLPPGPKAVVVRSSLNQIRSEPSMRGNILTTLPVNRAVTALGRNRFTTWIKVELADGSSGWIGAFYVTADYDLSLLPEVAE